MMEHKAPQAHKVLKEYKVQLVQQVLHLKCKVLMHPLRSLTPQH
jgi:hypothetical protein